MHAIGKAMLWVGVGTSLLTAALPATAASPASGISDTPRGSLSATPAGQSDSPTPTPHDRTLAGHVLISGSAALYVPSGQLDETTHQRAKMGAGPAFALDLGFGVVGNLVVGAWGQYAFVGPGSACHDCTTSTIATGAFAAYHLRAEGAFDPWASAGLGYRDTSIGTGVVAPTLSYSGFEWLRLRLGANWYGFKHLGLGGFVELDGGTFTRKIEGSIANADFSNSDAHWALLAGVNIAFDSFGR